MPAHQAGRATKPVVSQRQKAPKAGKAAKRQAPPQQQQKPRQAATEAASVDLWRADEARPRAGGRQAVLSSNHAMLEKDHSLMWHSTLPASNALRLAMQLSASRVGLALLLPTHLNPLHALFLPAFRCGSRFHRKSVGNTASADTAAAAAGGGTQRRCPCRVGGGPAGLPQRRGAWGAPKQHMYFLQCWTNFVSHAQRPSGCEWRRVATQPPRLWSWTSQAAPTTRSGGRTTKTQMHSLQPYPVHPLIACAAAKRPRAAANGGAVPATVEVDAPGCSYNPDPAAHQDAVAAAVAAEVQKQIAAELRPKRPALLADGGPEPDELRLLQVPFNSTSSALLGDSFAFFARFSNAPGAAGGQRPGAQ